MDNTKNTGDIDHHDGLFVSLFDHAWPRKQLNFARRLAMVTTIALTGACAAPTPPSDAELQIAKAQASIAHAADMGANEYAVAEIQSARTRLASARDAARTGNVDQAIRFSREAQIDAALAEARLQAAKAELAASQLDDGRRILKKEIERKNQ